MATLPNYFLDGGTLPDNPFQTGVMEGLQFSTNLQNVQAANLQRQQLQQEAALKLQAQQRAQEQQAELQTLLNNPTPASTKDLLRISALLPKDQSASVLSVYDKLTAAQQQSAIKQAGQIYASMQSGNLDVTKSLLQQQADAARNSGNEEEAKAAETYIKMLDINPTGAQKITGIIMAVLPGGKEALENIDKTFGTTRAEELQPTAVRKATAEAESKETEAKFAEQVAKADLAKKAADLGLTKAQTNQALAQTRKLSTEIQKAALELQALQTTGGVDPEKKFTQEEKIRREWQGRSKMYSELQGTFNTLKASADSANGPGDIALIVGFQKMLDPGSVVRETEFATARDTAGLYQQLQNMAQKVKDGQLLNSTQRTEYINLARKYLEAAQKQAEQEKKNLGIVVKNYKLNPENVFGEEQPATPPPPSGGGASNATISVTAPNGQIIVFPNQQAADAFRKATGLP